MDENHKKNGRKKFSNNRIDTSTFGYKIYKKLISIDGLKLTAFVYYLSIQQSPSQQLSSAYETS